VRVVNRAGHAATCRVPANRVSSSRFEVVLPGNPEPTDFFSTVADDAYTFETDSKGKVTAMILHADGKDISIKRIE
jgi:hypothetical protein